MASKGKGNIFYEILIVVLTVALIATIMYPSKTWKQESDSTEICQTRMATIQHLELQYIGLTNTYSDSVDKIMAAVLANDAAVVALDSIVNWEGLVADKELKTMINDKDINGSLKTLIQEKIVENKPLGKLAVWDSVQYKLIDQLKETLASQDTLNTLSVDSSIAWNFVINDDVYAYSLDFEMPRRVKSRTKSALQKGIPVYETPGWEYLKPAFYDSLNKTIELALLGDVWKSSENKAWAKVKRAQFEAEMDLSSQEVKDSLWLNTQQSFWEQEKPLVWKAQRKALYKAEGEAWRRDNEATWSRIISQEWETSRKKQWQTDQLETLADSALAVFKAEKDSIWRSIVEDIREEEYVKWETSQEKHIDETVQNLWEQETRITWEDGAYAEWLEKKAANPDKVWKDLKEYIWSNINLSLWKVEQEKLSKKTNALYILDIAINYNKLMEQDAIESLVNGLTLPDSKDLLKKMDSLKELKGSKLAALGVVDLFRDQLLEKVTICPLSLESHIINAVNDQMPKYVSIECPIVITDSTKYALVIEKTMNDSLGVVSDSTKVPLELTFAEKMLGGGKIVNHGKIDDEGRKSWEKKGR